MWKACGTLHTILTQLSRENESLSIIYNKEVNRKVDAKNYHKDKLKGKQKVHQFTE